MSPHATPVTTAGTTTDARTHPIPDDGGFPSDVDVLVVGGGAAGTSAAVALSRARRSVLLVDAGHPRNAPADGVHNYLGREGTPPTQLIADGHDDVRAYGGTVVNDTVTSLRATAQATPQGTDAGPAFTAVLADGAVVHARRVLVATGLVDELPELPGVAERWGRDVLHCPYCHGWEVRDQAIGILGTSPASMHQALLFRQWSADVTLFQHTMGELSDTDLERLAARGIGVVTGLVDRLEVTDDRLSGLVLADGRSVPRQAVVVAPRFVARAEVVAGLGLEPVPQLMGEHVVGSFLPADARGMTSVPGVWVAGNASDVAAQVVTSAAAGLMAGAHINADLMVEDTNGAVQVLRAGRAD